MSAADDEAPSVHDQVHAFADGELPPDEAARFREHLAGCAECQAELHDIMMLAAVSSTHAAALQATPPKAEAPLPKIVEAPVIPLASRRRRLLVAVSSGLALAAALAVAWRVTRPTPIVLAQADARPIEARLSYDGAARWRPYDVMRSANRAHEEVPVDTLARLEARGDRHGLGVGYLLSGDDARAAQLLGEAGESPAVLCDRAALALARGEPAEALAAAEAALAASPGLPAALWNRALALRDLGLPLAAAESFDLVAVRGEPGWGDEAHQRAARLRTAEVDRERAFRAADAAAKAMVAGGPPPPAELVRGFAGLMRRAYYDALHAAASKARLAELKPVAEALDAAAASPTLVPRLAATTPAPAALAKAYAALAANPASLSPAAADAYLAQLARAHANGLRLGALVLLGRTLSARAEVRALAAADGDPWWLSIADEADAQAALGAGDAAAAETLLRAGEQRCLQARIEARAAALELALAEAQMQRRELDAAAETARAGLARARGAGVDPRDLVRRFLVTLSQVARARNQAALANAYVAEARLHVP